MRAGRLLAVLAIVALVGAACGGGDDDDSAADTERERGGAPAAETTTTEAAPTAPADPIAAEAEIRANYEKYFSSATPDEEALALAEDVEVIGETLQQAEASAAGLGERSIQITRVTFTGADSATVGFDILLDGNVALPGFIGDAVLEDGVWKVGRKTNCDLAALQGFTCPAA